MIEGVWVVCNLGRPVPHGGVYRSPKALNVIETYVRKVNSCHRSKMHIENHRLLLVAVEDRSTVEFHLYPGHLHTRRPIAKRSMQNGPQPMVSVLRGV